MSKEAFEQWERNQDGDELADKYREYLLNSCQDKDFDIMTIENWQEWLIAEWEKTLGE